MYHMMSLPLDELTLSEYMSWPELWREVRELGCHGVEAIWGGDEIPGDFPRELVMGYHLTFYPDWLDFYREDKPALLRKFGSLDAVRSFYGGWGPGAPALLLSGGSGAGPQPGTILHGVPCIGRISGGGLQ